MNASIARVALDLPIDKFFDFSVPGATDDDVGRLVVVPFGNKLMSGVIVEVTNTTEVPAAKLKPVAHVQRALPKFSADDIALVRFCEDYYHHPFGPIALNGLPPAMRSVKAVQPKTDRIAVITREGMAAIATLSSRAVAQRSMLEALQAAPQSAAQLRDRHDRAAATLRTLISKGWVEFYELAPGTIPEPTQSAARQPSGPVLNAGQQNAVTRIAERCHEFSAFLLSGITGSGKTEVYLRVIAQVLESGKQALVLMPEINLTPQFLRRLQARFPDSHVVQQHSGMADVLRMSGYLDAESGRADIVIGTRLAVFTSMPRLGVIVVDEEHDASFKQQEGFRYNARDVAVFRARLAGCPVVLGSATPSLESLQNAARGRFIELKLPERAAANAVLPRVDFIDLNTERAENGLSATMIKALTDTVARGEQALVFINRRGYSPALVCAQCGWMPECKRCSARLVFHQQERRLKCHHCGYQSRIPASCDECGSHEMVAAGQGTERVEIALREHLREARIARVDRDSTRRRGSAEKIFEAAALGELDILVGTQMLSKGHDFPRITLVGVVNADGGMFSADFRAAERLAAQLMQVAGRAGRGDLPGRVLIQTRFASHPLYQAVAAQDHARFADIALAERKVARLPPYTFLALLRAEAKTAAALKEFMAHAVEAARTTGEMNEPGPVHVWDPVPAPLARKAGWERGQLLVQSDGRGSLQKFLAAWLPRLREREWRAVKWVIDVDPQDV